jgi:ribosome biogenesis GTPase A
MPITFVQPLSLPSVFFLVVAIATFFFILRIIKVRIFQFKLQLDNLPNLPTVLIVGAPMAGKSSLFSRFADREKILSVSNYAIGLAKLSDGKFLQLIDPPRVIPPADGESLREKVNLVLFVFFANLHPTKFLGKFEKKV